jgi:hypothetical protein
MTKISRMWLVFLSVGIGLGAVAASEKPAASRGGFDGLWSVSIITEAGSCDRAYKYPIQISDGNVAYHPDPGGPSIDISGKVEAAGQVKVSVRRGDQFATGTGRLSPSGGAGTWVGRASSRECSGRWEAERK